MLQYKIPQDVQIEDRITSFLTVRQMIVSAIGGGIAYVVYISLVDRYYAEVWLPPVVLIIALTLAIAFVKINGLSFVKWVLLLMEFLINPRKRVWEKTKSDEIIFNFVTSKRFTQEASQKKQAEVQTKDLSALAEITRKIDKNPFENIQKSENTIDEADDHKLAESVIMSEDERSRHEKRLDEAILANIKPRDPEKLKQSLQAKIAAKKQEEKQIEIEPAKEVLEIEPAKEPEIEQEADQEIAIEHKIIPVKQAKSIQKRQFAIPEIALDNAKTVVNPTPQRFRPVRDKKINTLEKPKIPEEHKQELNKKDQKQDQEIKINIINKKDEQ